MAKTQAKTMAKTLRNEPNKSLAGMTGCGQTDYFAVAGTISPTISSGNLEQIARCEVMTSGAVSDQTTFVLSYSVCGPNTNYTGLEKDSAGNNVLGTFEYGTTKPSGSVHFDLKLYNGSSQPLGSGHADGDVKGGVVPVTLNIDDVSGLK